jgi:DNA mismatch endonuclease, patch repair protein
MLANRSIDTGPELALRRALHARGLRFRNGLRIEASGRHVKPDVVFTRARVAVFVDGCFWHRCPEHATDPKSNASYWQAKFDRNVTRDRAVDAALLAEGWQVVRVWEHERADAAAERVAAEVHATRAG